MRTRYFPARFIRILKSFQFCLIPISFVSFVILVFMTALNALIKDARMLELRRLEDALERDSVCDRLGMLLQQSNRSTMDPAVRSYNSTVLEFCQRLERSRQHFFERRAKPIDRFEHRFILNDAGQCDNQTRLLIVVHSLHNYVDRRMAIRRTWGSAARVGSWPGKELPGRVRLVFMFGRHSDSQLEDALRLESMEYEDIVQGDFVEGYRNMTLKSLLGLHWFHVHCPGAEYMFKCDDDMFVNIPHLMQAIRDANMTSWSIMGPLNIASKVQRHGKWAISKSDYPFYYYPPYESGSGYVITADLVYPLVELADFVPRIFIDDVYVTGILGKILNIRHVRRGGFAYWTDKPPALCDILTGSILTGTKVTPDMQYQLWSGMVNRSSDCHDDKKLNCASTLRMSEGSLSVIIICVFLYNVHHFLRCLS